MPGSLMPLALAGSPASGRHGARACRFPRVRAAVRVQFLDGSATAARTLPIRKG